MTDPFIVALDALFASPIAKDALYTAPGGQQQAIRVIRDQASEQFGETGRRLVQDPNHFSIRRSEVPQPVKGAILNVGTETFRLNGAPMLDVEGITWDCPAEPA